MPSLSWEEFLNKARSFPSSGIPVADLVRLVRQVQITPDLIEPHVAWSSDHYTRTPLLQLPALEALVLCWEDGQETVIHDHGPSCAVARVISGTTLIENFRQADAGGRPGYARLELIETCDLHPGSVCASDVGAIHSMGNRQGERRRMITLNFYSPPLSRIRTFDRETGKIGEKLYPELLETI